MKFKNQTKFFINSLNQEKLLNTLCKQVSLSDIERKNKNETTFVCSYFDHKKVEKFLKEKNVKIVSIEYFGPAYNLKKIITSYGLICAIILFFAFYFIQNQFVWQYEINGLEKLDNTEIMTYVKNNYSNNKNKISTEDIELGLMQEFDEISFVSCIIKGQTLVINIKEKLWPDEIYGEFSPVVSKKDGKITEINLISGTAKVKVGDIVKKGDVLIEPYVVDASGEIQKVEAKGDVFAEVYNEGSCDHYEKYIQVERTGRKVEQNVVTLFGLAIYNFVIDVNFDMYEVEYEDVDLTSNLFLPFKMKKTIYYELVEKVIESKFEDVREEYIAKAKEKALENCDNCDKIIDEFYTLRYLSGVTIVNYCIVTAEQIGGAV